MRSALTFLTALALGTACGVGDGSGLGTQGYNQGSLKIQNSEGERAVLRTGTALSLGADLDLELEGDTVYQVKVANIDTGTLLAQAKLLTDPLGRLELTTVAHDLGEFDDVQDEHTLQVTVDDVSGGVPIPVANVEIPLTPHIYEFRGQGFRINEVQPPHVYSCGADGKPLNAFVVGALPDPGEAAAPIYAAGEGFPLGSSKVDIYVVRDGDAWRGKAIPQPGSPEYIAGPIVGDLVDGVLAPTKLDWAPRGADIGPYDILVDVDRDGTFDYSLAEKDGADGEDKVGLTLQYGQAWTRAKTASVAARVSADAAAKAHTAADAAAKDAAAAAGSSPDAQSLAQQAQTKANEAKTQKQLAESAATAAEQAFARELADDVTAQAKAADADAAAKLATQRAEEATALVGDTQRAQEAYEARMKALAAASLSHHLIVNLAFDSGSRNGAWTNDYTTSSKIFSYVNPPVQRGERHAFVTKLVIRHQSWKDFWSNSKYLEEGGKAGFGRIKISNLVAKETSGSTQVGCTNSPPVTIINPGVLPFPDGVQVLKYDVVFDYDNDGYYDIGRDMLDIVGNDTSGQLKTVKDLETISDEQLYGFKVVK